MIKPIKKVRFDKLRKETEKVMRWNVCQKIAKLLYHSDRGTNSLKEQMHLLDQEVIIDNRKRK